MLTLIVAALSNGGIGQNGSLPWRIPGDMRYFQLVTSFMGRRPGSAYPLPADQAGSTSDLAPLNVVIMGRKTWDSIPPKFRPLKDRLNVVLSRNNDFCQQLTRSAVEGTPVCAFSSLDNALAHVKSIPHTNVFIIGGAQLYSTSLALGSCQRILLTTVKSKKPIDCDAFFPDISPDVFRKADEQELRELVGPGYPNGLQHENGFQYEFQIYVRTQLARVEK